MCTGSLSGSPRTTSILTLSADATLPILRQGEYSIGLWLELMTGVESGRMSDNIFVPPSPDDPYVKVANALIALHDALWAITPDLEVAEVRLRPNKDQRPRYEFEKAMKSSPHYLKYLVPYTPAPTGVICQVIDVMFTQVEV